MSHKNTNFIAIKQKLNSLGWCSAGAQLVSNQMQKNDCILVFHYGAQPLPINSFVHNDTFTHYLNNDSNEVGLAVVPKKVFSAPKRCHWHLEKDGYLIDYGKFECELSFTCLEGLSKQVLEEIDKIDKWSTLNNLLIKPARKKYCTIQSRECIKQAVTSTVGINMGSSFRCINPQYNNIFKEDTIYYLHGAESNYAIIKTYKADNSGFRRCKDILLDAGFFVQMVQNKDLEPVEFKDTYVLKDTICLQDIKSINHSLISLPEEYMQFNLSIEQEGIVTLAYNNCYNLTPLLDNNYTSEATQALYDYLNYGFNANCFIGKHLSAEQIKAYTELSNAGYDIRHIINERISAVALQDMVRENEQEFKSIIPTLLSEGFSDNQIEYMRTVYLAEFSIDMIKRNVSPLAMQLLYENYLNTNPILKNLIDKGICTDSSIYATWDSITSDEKVEVIQYLKLNTDIQLNDISWNTLVDKCIQKASYLEFKKTTGIRLIADNIALSKDENSVIVSKVTGDPFVRAMLINNKIFLIQKEQIFI